jgi:hypothetical protein
VRDVLAAAIGTGAAPGKRHHDVIAGFYRTHAAADRRHHARAFMTEHGRVGRAVIGIAPMQVGLAHAAGNDTHQHLIGARIGQFEPIDDERRGTLGDDGGGD